MQPSTLCIDPGWKDHGVIVEEGLRLGDEPDAVPRARRFAAALLDAAGLTDLVPDVELVVSELATNALLHAEKPIVVRVHTGEKSVRVEVQDSTRHHPLRGVAGSEAMTGRGIGLVEAVCRHWGVESTSGGKVVWAELAVGGAPDSAPEMDEDALLDAWGDDDLGPDQRFTVRLGDVPTGLLLAAKAHVDNIVREFHLAATGAASGHSAAVPPPLAQLIETVVHRFADARQAIKRQALTAATRGDGRTELTLTLPASAADAGEAYLAALDKADSYARAARLLTSETPPQHRVFRRWYVESLIIQLRAAAAGKAPAPPQTFEERLLEELTVVAAAHRATDHAARLQSVTAALAGAVTEDEVSAVVVTEGVAALGASGGGLFLPTGEDQLTVSAAIGNADPRGTRQRRAQGDAEGPAAFAVRTGEPVWLEFVHGRDREYPAVPGFEAVEGSVCAIPLVTGQRTLGALRFSFDASRLFDEAERRFILALAAQTAQALDRARALTEARKATARLAFLADASAALSATLDYRDTLGTIARLVVPGLADWCTVRILDDGTLNTVAVAHTDPAKVAYAHDLQERYPAGAGADRGARKVVRTGMAEMYPEVTDSLLVEAGVDPAYGEIMRQLGLRSVLIVPLVGRHGTLGAITMVQAESGRQFDENDLLFAEEVARRAGIAVENARQHVEQTDRLASMTRVAETVQRAILAPVPQRVGSVELAATYVSAAQDALVGGDLYEVIVRPGGVRLLIGDVRGKGLDAVRLATVVLGGFRSAAVEYDDLATLARTMDTRIRPYLSDEDFVTALIAEIRDDGTCRIVDCGHPPALLARGGQITPIGCDESPPLGLGAAPTPVTVRLEPGDRLLLHTDGLIEARDAEGRFANMADVVRPLADGGTLPEALDGILARLREAVGADLGDDLALLVAEYRPE
jgi:serine phosphatase RsbU (regulator of sigma subunit)/anti-sigma regulatory factor (Ser/Thr protein kinase)